MIGFWVFMGAWITLSVVITYRLCRAIGRAEKASSAIRKQRAQEKES